MHKLYLVMVGLPARGKSRLARRICGGLAADGFRSAIFNNGDVRRELLGAESTGVLLSGQCRRSQDPRGDLPAKPDPGQRMAEPGR